jgi:hypothetical protein
MADLRCSQGERKTDVPLTEHDDPLRCHVAALLTVSSDRSLSGIQQIRPDVAPPEEVLILIKRIGAPRG